MISKSTLEKVVHFRPEQVVHFHRNKQNVLTFSEMCSYTGFSHSYGYKLTHLQKIPCSKPAGKMLFFDRLELEKWLLNNQAAHEEIENAASTYVTLNKRGGRS